MNLKENIKQAIDEVLGVPDNIVNVANQIYDEVINHIDEDENVGDFDNVYSYIKGKFKVGDLKFKNIEYVFDFKENQQDSDVGMVGMATGGSFKVTKNFKIKSTMDNNTFHIKFVLFAPQNATGKDIKEYLKKEKNEIISSITHELKHKYDDYKKPKTSLTARGEYSAYSNRGFGDIDPINKFLHHLYFTHSIENLVRPSELAGSIQSGEITKKDFYNFLMDNRVYKELKKIQNFTYEGFREELRDYLDKIKVLFDMKNDLNDVKKLTLELMKGENSTDVKEKNQGLIEKIYGEDDPVQDSNNLDLQSDINIGIHKHILPNQFFPEE